MEIISFSFVAEYRYLYLEGDGAKQKDIYLIHKNIKKYNNLPEGEFFHILGKT
jgi:hypothetical protein